MYRAAVPVSSGELSGWLKCITYLHHTIYLLTLAVLVLEMPDASWRCTVTSQEVACFRKGNSRWREGQKNQKMSQSSVVGEGSGAGYL